MEIPSDTGPVSGAVEFGEQPDEISQLDTRRYLHVALSREGGDATLKELLSSLPKPLENAIRAASNIEAEDGSINGLGTLDFDLHKLLVADGFSDYDSRTQLYHLSAQGRYYVDEVLSMYQSGQYKLTHLPELMGQPQV